MFKTGALDSVADAYVDEDIGTATPGTRLEADDRNIIQQELVNAIEGSGQTLDASGVFTNNSQLWKATISTSNIVLKTSSGTYSKPAKLNFIEVTVVGAGGGGGGAETTDEACATGGGGGGASIKTILASALSASETVTIGAGGPGGTSGGDGVNGGTTSLGSHCSATGGAGGNGSVATGSVTGRSGGIGSNGDINIEGGGSPSVVGITSGGEGVGGAGGNSLLGGSTVSSTQVGNDGSQYGSGGSGARRISGVGRPGGAGADGVILIKEYF